MNDVEQELRLGEWQTDVLEEAVKSSRRRFARLLRLYPLDDGGKDVFFRRNVQRRLLDNVLELLKRNLVEAGVLDELAKVVDRKHSRHVQQFGGAAVLLLLNKADEQSLEGVKLCIRKLKSISLLCV